MARRASAFRANRLGIGFDMTDHQNQTAENVVSLDEALGALGVTPEQAAAFLRPLIVQVLGEQIAAPMEQLNAAIQAIPHRVQEITLEQVRPSAEALNQQLQQAQSMIPQMAPSAADLQHADGHYPTDNRFHRVMDHPRFPDVIEKVLDKFLTPSPPPDPLSQAEKFGDTFQRMQQIIQAFTIPTGIPEHEVQRRLSQAWDTGMRTGINTKMNVVGGGPAAVPLPEVPVEASLNRPGRQPISRNGDSHPALLQFYQ